MVSWEVLRRVTKAMSQSSKLPCFCDKGVRSQSFYYLFHLPPSKQVFCELWVPHILLEELFVNFHVAGRYLLRVVPLAPQADLDQKLLFSQFSDAVGQYGFSEVVLVQTVWYILLPTLLSFPECCT